MANYGVTDKGFIKKRLYDIKKETQEDMSAELGFDVAQNPQSVLNVFISTFSGKIAELWELAEAVYYSQYPTTATGVSLDYVASMAGISRKQNTRTRYLIACKGVDGTTIPALTRISTKTAPKTYFTIFKAEDIVKSSFNKAEIKVATLKNASNYTITINDNAYTIVSEAEATEESVLRALMDILSDDYIVSMSNIDGSVLTIENKSDNASEALKLSDNLTTVSVTSLVTFYSEDFGKIVVPKGNITEIESPTTGFISCSNINAVSYGSEAETDSELRSSYLKKLAMRSSTMLDSIKSAITENVEGVASVSAYENDTDSTDSEGRPPHSIEVVVDGGEETEIATEILKLKAAGISTYGSEKVIIPDEYDGTLTINFNRPQTVYAWLKVNVVPRPAMQLPLNYAEIIKQSIMTDAALLGAGDGLISQDLIGNIKQACANIAYVDIYVYGTTEQAYSPTEADYTEHNLFVTRRQKIVCDASRMEVVS